jgi:hypothetical protein
MSTAEERMQNEIDQLEQENRLLRARNDRLQAELKAAPVQEPDDDLTQALIERDEYHSIADQLAEVIAQITGADIGEHTSSNFPWHNALDAAKEWIATPPAEEIVCSTGLCHYRKPLTDEEIKQLADKHLDVGDGERGTHYVFGEIEFTRAIEAKLRRRTHE